MKSLRLPSLRALLLVLLAFHLSGCSYLFMEPPPPQHARLDSFQCRTSRGTPTLDVIYGITQTISSVGLLLVAADSEARDSDRQTAITYLLPGAISGVVAYASAAYGFAAAAECEQALEQLAQRQEQTRDRQMALEEFRLQREHARARREAQESNVPTPPTPRPYPTSPEPTPVPPAPPTAPLPATTSP